MTRNLSRRLYFRNAKDWQKISSKKKISKEKLVVQVIENGIVLPARNVNNIWKGGVCDKDFNFIAGFSRNKNTQRGGDFLQFSLHMLSITKKLLSLMRMSSLAEY